MKNTNCALITVLDSINQTTMPYNEFILYRSKHYPVEKQIVLLTGNEILIPENEIPSELEIYKVGKNPLKIRKALKTIVHNCRANNIGWVLHLHSIRGSFSTIIGMIGVLPRKSSIYTIHSTFTGYRLHNKILSFVDALFSNYVTCVSNTSYTKFPNVVKRHKGKRMCAIQNGVNIERIEDDIINLIPQKNNNIIKFVYIARMVELKYHTFLVDVLCLLKEQGYSNLRFVFIGEEEDGGKVRNYAIDKGVFDMIEFTGLLPRKDVYTYLVNSDVYISSSTLEGLPVSVLEGMFCGLPAILSDIPQHKEVANGCDSVCLVPFDVKQWSEVIVHFLHLSNEERHSMGLESKKHVQNNFSLESMHCKYDKKYEEIRAF